MKSEYLYVIYSDADYERIDNIFLEIYKKGIPIKSAKDSAPFQMSDLISQSAAVMLVITHNSMSSNLTMQQISMAEKCNRHIIPYYLSSPEDVQLSGNLLMKMDGSATIPAYEYPTEQALVGRIMTELAPYFKDPSHSHKKVIVPIAIAAVVLVALVVIALFAGQPIRHKQMMEHIRNSTVQIVSLDEDYEATGTGSGFFINKSGLIATNYHVIEDCSYFKALVTNEGEYYDAVVVDTDPGNDLALLMISPDYQVRTYLEFATEPISVGDTVYVSGYPQGIDLTISNGIISNQKHYADDLEYFLITAAVSPGNSGGPVLDDSGKVIGIATAKYIDAENMNLARPVSYLKAVLKAGKKSQIR